MTQELEILSCGELYWQSHDMQVVASSMQEQCLAAAGKGVHPTLRYRDTDGNVFSETTNSFGCSETTSLLTANPSTSTQSATLEASQSEPQSPSSSSASEAAPDSDPEDREEEAVSHLQRLQGLAGSWRRHNKQPRLGKDYREGSAGQQEHDVPEAAAMQVYVHGINETGLQSALEKSSLWHRIELNNNLEVGMVCLQCQSMSCLCLVLQELLTLPRSAQHVCSSRLAVHLFAEPTTLLLPLFDTSISMYLLLVWLTRLSVADSVLTLAK